MGGAWLLERSVHIDDVKNFLFKAVIRKRLCRVESKRARFAHDHVCPHPERCPLDAVEHSAEKKAGMLAEYSAACYDENALVRM